MCNVRGLIGSLGVVCFSFIGSGRKRKGEKGDPSHFIRQILIFAARRNQTKNFNKG